MDQGHTGYKRHEGAGLRSSGLCSRGSVRCAAFVSFITFVSFVTPASAELVFFSSGRTLSIKSHHVDGNSLVLTMRGGGEIVCEALDLDPKQLVHYGLGITNVIGISVE